MYFHRKKICFFWQMDIARRQKTDYNVDGETLIKVERKGENVMLENEKLEETAEEEVIEIDPEIEKNYAAYLAPELSPDRTFFPDFYLRLAYCP